MNSWMDMGEDRVWDLGPRHLYEYGALASSPRSPWSLDWLVFMIRKKIAERVWLGRVNSGSSNTQSLVEEVKTTSILLSCTTESKQPDICAKRPRLTCQSPVRAPFSGSEGADPRTFPLRGVQVRPGAHVPGRGAAACFSEACVLNRRPGLQRLLIASCHSVESVVYW